MFRSNPDPYFEKKVGHGPVFEKIGSDTDTVSNNIPLKIEFFLNMFIDQSDHNLLMFLDLKKVNGQYY